MTKRSTIEEIMRGHGVKDEFSISSKEIMELQDRLREVLAPSKIGAVFYSIPCKPSSFLQSFFSNENKPRFEAIEINPLVV